MKMKFDLERIIDDFIFFCFFIGNDFLPSLSALDIAEDINEGKNILLVDDILDSGRTMNELLTDWGQTRDKIGIAVLVYNIQQKIKPDYFGTVIDREVDKDWINFWWEKDVNEK